MAVRKPSTSAKALAQRQRQDIAYALRLSGEYSLTAIAAYPDPTRPGQPLYADRSGAKRAIDAAADRHAAGDTSIRDRRRIADERYETLLRAVWGKAISGGRGYLFAIDRVLAIMRDQNVLLGLNAPKQVEVTSIETDFDRAFRELEAEIGKRAAEAAVRGITLT